eukprot:m.463622 g.463622  ORF g.463622 m.463622 type:complete len:257 (+) comp23111_c0_seq1:286-1056(+)
MSRRSMTTILLLAMGWAPCLATNSPTLAPQHETETTIPLSVSQALSSLSTAEKQSLQSNASIAFLNRLNMVNAGLGTNLTIAAVSRTVLSELSTRLRQNVVVFSAFFIATEVSAAEAASAALTITSGNPLRVEYVLDDGSIASATGTAAVVRAGTAAPTAAPSNQSKGPSFAAVGVVGAVLLLAIVGSLVLWKVHQARTRELRTQTPVPKSVGNERLLASSTVDANPEESWNVDDSQNADPYRQGRVTQAVRGGDI